MAYKKYIKRGGKTYGPYLYENKRVNGRVVTRYVGQAKEEKINGFGFNLHYFILILFISFAFLFMYLEYNGDLDDVTGKVIFNLLNPEYDIGEPIGGNVEIKLRQGEGLPVDGTSIKIDYGNDVKEIALSSLIDAEISEGQFYLEGFSIDGEGEVFGIPGEKEVDVEFELLVFDEPEEEQEEAGEEDSDEVEDTEEEVENEVDSTDGEEVDLSPDETEEDNDEVEDTEEVNEELGEEDASGEDEDSSGEENSEEEDGDEEESSEEEDSGESITGSVVSQSSFVVSGEVSKSESFEYTLEEGQSAEIAEGSVKVNGEEIDGAEIGLLREGDSVIVSTDHVEKGFGEDFLGDGEEILEIDLLDFELEAIEDFEDIEIDLLYEDGLIVELDKKIAVTDVPMELVDDNVTDNNQTNITGNDTNASVSVEKIQGVVTLGQPVKIIKRVDLDTSTKSLTVEVPKEAENVKIVKVVKKKEADEDSLDLVIVREDSEDDADEEDEIEVYDADEIEEIEDIEEVLPEQGISITGDVSLVLSLKKKPKVFLWVEKVIKKMSTLTALVVSQGEGEVSFTDENVEEVEIEYEIPGPQLAAEVEYDRESDGKEGKKLEITSEVHFENVVVPVTLRDELGVTSENKLRVNWIETGQELPITTSMDMNDDGNIDYIETVLPHTSNQTLEIIVITAAEHLDSNRSFISDIFEEVRELDGIWSETIPSGDFVRVVFEKNLTSVNDITVYPRSVSGSPRIEIYEFNGTELIAEFTSLVENEYNKVYLDDLEGEQDTFDLLILSGDAEFDHIIDPTFAAQELFEDCDDIGDWSESGGGWESVSNECKDSTDDFDNMTSVDLDLSGVDNATLSFTCDLNSETGLTTNFTVRVSNDSNDYVDVFSMECSGGACLPCLPGTFLLNDYITLTNDVNIKGTCGITGGRVTGSYCIWDNINVTSYYFTADAINPVVNLIAPVNGTFVASNSVSFNATFSDNIDLDNATFYLWNSTNSVVNTTVNTISGSADSVNLSVTLPYEDTFLWNYWAFDNSSNSAFNHSNFSIIYDVTNPVVAYISPTIATNGSVTQNYIEINVTATDTNLDTIIIRLYNSTHGQIELNTSSVSAFYINYSGLSDGVYYYNATANDSAGNAAELVTLNLTLTSDSSPPGVTINFPADSGVYGPADLPLLFNVSLDENGSVQYSLDGGVVNVTMTGDQGLFGTVFNASNASIADGSYTFSAYANDTAGNNNYTESVSFTYNSSYLTNCPITLDQANTVYYLQNDISTTGTCFTITAHNVTLDGQGYRIDGDDGLADYGVTSTSIDNTTVTNIEIQDFGQGVRFISVSGSRVEHSNFTSTAGEGIYMNGLVSDSGISVVNNSFFSIASDGMELANGINDAVIANNTFDNVRRPIYIQSSSADTNMAHNTLVYGNNITGGSTLSEGIYITNGANLSVYDNYLDSSADFSGDTGIKLGLSQIYTASNNTFYNNTMIAFDYGYYYFVGEVSENNMFANSSIQDSEVAAIYVDGPDVTFENISIVGTLASQDDLYVDAGSNITLIDMYHIGEYDLNGIGPGILVVRDKTYGEIRFLSNVSGSGTNFTSNVSIADNYVFVDSASLPGLNVSANVTLYGTPGAGLTNPVILKDGSLCSAGECNNFTALDAATVIFNVTGWSNYSLGENVDSINPGVEFADPTPSSGSLQTGNSIFVNVSSNDTNRHYVFSDFDSSLVLWMRMDDVNGSGDPTDLSGYSNNGSLADNAVINNTSGHWGNGTYLDGTNDEITVSDSNSLEPSSEITVSAWIKTGQSAVRYIVHKLKTTDPWEGYALAIHTEGTNNIYDDDEIAFWVGNSWVSYDLDSDSLEIDDSEWHHIVATNNGTTTCFYWEGVQRDCTAVSFASTANSEDLRIGHQAFLDTYFTGFIDEVLIFNRSLSSTEIAALYNASTVQYESNFTDLADGTHTFTGHAVDMAGNRNQTETRNVTIDSSAPALSYVSPTDASNGSAAQDFIEINVTATDTNLDTIIIRLYNSTHDQIELNTSSVSAFYINYSGLSDGVYYYNASANDSAGNIAELVTLNLTLDNVAPVFSSLAVSPSNGTNYASGQFYEFNVSVTDNVGVNTVWIDWEGTNYTSEVYARSGNVYSFNRTNLGGGTYNYTWHANDSADNVNNSGVQYYTISPAGSTIYTYLNHTRSDLNSTPGTIVELNASLVSGSGVVSLVITPLYGSIESGVSPINATFNFSIEAEYKVNGTFAGNENYTQTSEAWFVDVDATFAGEADTTGPNVTLLSPPNGTITSSAVEYYHGNFSDDDALKNATLHLWNSSALVGTNSTDLTGTTNSSNLSLTFPHQGTFFWNYLVYDNSSNAAWNETNFTIIYQLAGTDGGSGNSGSGNGTDGGGGSDPEDPGGNESNSGNNQCGQDLIGSDFCVGKTDGTVIESCDSCNTCTCSGEEVVCTEIACLVITDPLEPFSHCEIENCEAGECLPYPTYTTTSFFAESLIVQHTGFQEEICKLNCAFEEYPGGPIVRTSTKVSRMVECTYDELLISLEPTIEGFSISSEPEGFTDIEKIGEKVFITFRQDDPVYSDTCYNLRKDGGEDLIDCGADAGCRECSLWVPREFPWVWWILFVIALGILMTFESTPLAKIQRYVRDGKEALKRDDLKGAGRRYESIRRIYGRLDKKNKLKVRDVCRNYYKELREHLKGKARIVKTKSSSDLPHILYSKK